MTFDTIILLRLKNPYSNFTIIFWVFSLTSSHQDTIPKFQLRHLQG